MDDQAIEAKTAAPQRGMKAITGEEFHLAGALGGLRGVIETGAPGMIFVTVWTITQSLWPTLISAVAAALIAVVLRLIQRQPLTYAFSGVLGITLGVLLAWRSSGGGADDAQAAVRFFLPGILTNVFYVVASLISLATRWPYVGVTVEMLRLGFTERHAGQEEGRNPFKGFTAWRRDPHLMRRYTIATWVWIAGFMLRLAVQVPLFFADEAGALGVARLILGTPLWGLTLWLTWIIVGGAHTKEAEAANDDDTALPAEA